MINKAQDAYSSIVGRSMLEHFYVHPCVKLKLQVDLVLLTVFGIAAQLELEGERVSALNIHQ